MIFLLTNDIIYYCCIKITLTLIREKVYVHIEYFFIIYISSNHDMLSIVNLLIFIYIIILKPY